MTIGIKYIQWYWITAKWVSGIENCLPIKWDFPFSHLLLSRADYPHTVPTVNLMCKTLESYFWYNFINVCFNAHKCISFPLLV